MTTPAPTAPVRTRPPLDLGPMTGPPDYILARAQSLTRAYAGLLDVPEIELIDSGAQGGKTDCSKKIWVPLQDPEGYLVLEHELSHWLFETDVVMASKYVEMLVGRMLNRAGISPKTDEALPYEKHLRGIVHHLWNVLEDWRCCWLWTQLYAGGGALLQQRWRDIVAHEYPPEALKKNLVTCLTAYAAGTEVADTPPAFEDCKKAMRRALNLVEGTGPVACLAITGRLIDEVCDALLDNNPYKPPPPAAGGGGGAGNPVQQRLERDKQARARAEHLLKLLASMVPRSGPHALKEDEGGGSLGGGDLQAPPPQKDKFGRERQAKGEGRLAAIQQLERADDKNSDDSGMTPFQLIMAQDADAMEARLEEARRAMMRNQDTPDEANTVICLGWSRECGIPIVHVKPLRELPPPTATADANRRILEQLRMKKRVKKDYEGEFHADAFLAAVGAGELDRPFYERSIRVPRFELLFVFDVSGSMLIGQAMALTERALADSVHAVRAIKSKTSMWAYSDRLYMFDEVGSPYAQGISHGSTCTVQALDVAHRWGKKSPTTRAIMLVTDGWPTSCRAQNSTGNPLDDLHAVLKEIRGDKIPLSVLGIRHASCTVEQTRNQYDRAFGAGTYGMVGGFDEVAKELPKAVRIMAEMHVAKGARRS